MSDLIDHLKWKLINWLAGYSVGEELNRTWHEGMEAGLAFAVFREGVEREPLPGVTASQEAWGQALEQAFRQAEAFLQRESKND